MQVILLQDVEPFGNEGDVIEVADGHARNFLFPKHLAVPATDQAIRDAAQRAAAARRDAERELYAMERLAESIDGQEVTMTASASASGTLYGGIGVPAIAAALAECGFHVDPAWVLLTQPVKEIGEHVVRFQFPHGLEAEITLIVEAET